MFTEKKPTAELMLPFYKKLKKAWCRESCSPSLRENRPNDNIAKGQCFVTAIAVWETFGGEVFELKISENEIHYYNVINGEIVDLSSEQFGDQITADFYRAGEPSNVALRILFTVRALDADDCLLGESTFLYDVAQEKLFVTIAADGVTCSTSDAPNAPADVPPVLTLPILGEIDTSVTSEATGSSQPVVHVAVKLIEWGLNTGLDPDEISDATFTWLAAKIEDLTEILHKLELVDGVYQRLLTGEARELLDSAGCENVEITWASDPIEPIEAIMQAAGLRSTAPEAWKIAFEKSLFENYGAKPHHYEDLGDGVYQVYVEIDGKIVPYVAVDSKTGDYHG